MARLQLHILGTPRVTDAQGGDTGLPLGKPLALLALVALDRSGVTRDDAAALLWPGSSRDRALASVRQALWTLRTKLDPEVITEGADGALHAGPAVLATDLDELAEAVREADAEAVVRLWQGGPFKGFALPDAPGWNQWASELHAQWEVRVGSFLESHAEGLPAAEALHWLDHALSVRSWRVPVHTARVRTLLELGRLEEADQALVRAREEIAGGEEDDETELAHLQEAVRAAVRGRYEAEEGNVIPVAFVGRAAEFAVLADALREVRGGRSRSVGILGPPGIGKTRLAREFMRVAQAGGARTAEARGVAGETEVELGVVAALVRELLGMPGAAGISNGSAEALRSLVPSAGGSMPTAATRVSHAALGDALADLLDAVGEEVPLLLFVDDLHWVDPGSRALLRRAVRLVPRRPIFLLETCRSEEGDRTVLRSFRSQAESGDTRLLTLSPLAPDHITEILTELARFPSEEAASQVAEAIHEASRGHPLHVVSLIRTLTDQGVLERRHGEWIFDPYRFHGRLEMPRGLRELLERRLQEVSHDARLVMRRLAGRGRAERVALVRRASGLPEDRFAAAMAELISGDLVGWVDGQRVDFTHDLLREAVSRTSSRTGLPGGRGWWAAAVVVAAGAGALALGLWGEAVPPWDGTVLELRFPDALVWYAPAPDGSWQAVDSVGVVSTPDSTVRPFFPSGAGGWDVVAERRTPDRGPDVVGFRADGSRRVILDGGGDDGLQDISPDGLVLLISVQDTLSPRYRLDLRTVDLRTGEERTLLTPDFRAVAAWTPNGRALVAGEMGLGEEVDRLVRLRPDGSEIDRFDLPPGELWEAYPCGEGTTLIRFQPPGALVRWQFFDWETREMESISDPLGESRVLACSPDGDFLAALLQMDEDALSLVRRDGLIEVGTLPLHGRGASTLMRWTAASEFVPDQVVATAPDSLAWGGMGALAARVLDREGRPMEASVTWRALDPGVVNVREGRAVGNGPGTGRLVASVEGWLADTVAVRVTSHAAAGLLMADDFRDFPGHDWRIIGIPEARLTTFQGESVLSAGGDAVWLDAIRSVQTFAPDRGLTAEVQFRLPLTDRMDRQIIQICLVDGEAVVTTNSGPGAGGWATYCVAYPQGELSSFARDAVRLHGWNKGWILGLPAPGLGGEEWNSLGLQLRPDGRFSAIVNGVEAGVFPEPVEVPAGARFNLLIIGRAEDTELLLRNVTVREGARY